MIDLAQALAPLGAVFTLGEAASAGVTRSVLARAVLDESVVRLARGVYVARDIWHESSDRDRHLLLAHAAARERPWAAVSHQSAAAVHDLAVAPRLPTWVCLTTGGAPTSANVFAHDGLVRLEPAALFDGEVTDIDGRRVTTLPRTVVDCLRTMPLGEAVAIADSALRRSDVTVADLRLHRSRQRGWPGTVWADLAPWLADPSRESWFESVSFVDLWRHDIPLPEHQVRVYDRQDRFVARVDGLWREHGTVGEADGNGKYLGAYDTDGPSAEAAARAVLAERHREVRLQELGLEVARWAPTDRLDDRAARVEAAFARADPSRVTARFAGHPDSRHAWRREVEPPLPLSMLRRESRRRGRR